MERYSQSFTRIVHLLLVVALLLTFAAPAFAEGGPTPNHSDTNIIDSPQQASNPGLSPEELRKAESIQEHLSSNDLGQLELNGTASDLGISEAEYTLVLQFLQDINNGESVIEVESDSGEVVRIGTPDFAQAVRGQIQFGNDGKASPDFRLRYRHHTIYIYLNSRETWYIQHGALWVLTGILLYIGKRYGGNIGGSIAGSVALAIRDLALRYNPKRVDLRFPLKQHFPHRFYVRYWGSRIHWINGRWIPILLPFP